MHVCLYVYMYVCMYACMYVCMHACIRLHYVCSIRETLYEYGSRAGFWRLYNILTKRNLPVTAFAVGMALERNPTVAKAIVRSLQFLFQLIIF